ncbi:hypothetical protein CIB48_g6971 [Xylaria polymorpha]|nr:hypothetical protein CIB48_g6971 [Xylaria polymorpha]
MSTIIPEDEKRNYELFRDCLATALLEKISEPQTKPRRRTKAKPKKKTAISPPFHNDQTPKVEKYEAKILDHSNKSLDSHMEQPKDDTTIQDDDLADFTDYIATEIYACVPPELKTIDYHDYIASPTLQTQYSLPAYRRRHKHAPPQPGPRDLGLAKRVRDHTRGEARHRRVPRTRADSLPPSALDPAPAAELDARRRVRDLRARLDQPVVPSPHPPLRAREGREEGLASRGGSAECRLALWCLPSLCPSLREP